MAGKKRTVVTIETGQRTVIRQRGRQTVAWCERCRRQVLMLMPDEAAALAQISVRAVFRRVEAGALHFIETEAGTPFVCLTSLTQD